MTSSTTSAPRSAVIRRTVRSLAVTVVAAAAATCAYATLGGGPQPAQADPGDTVVAIGSSQLVQSEDLASIQVPLNTETVVLGRDTDFSSCLGEGNPWTAVLPGSPKPVQSVWGRLGKDDQSMTEFIAQAKSPAQAQQYATKLVRVAVRACRQPKLDFHYGPTRTDAVGSGTATWALSYSGSSHRADGGVVVIRKGVEVGLVEVHGSWGPADQTLESVAKVAVDRLR